jgi:cyanophycinase-like exopeptidase
MSTQPDTPIGPLVLAGSGEYTPAMDIIDRYFLERGHTRNVLLIATACAPEGLDVMERWEQMGRAHFARLGIDAKPLRIRDAEDANIPELAAQILEADFVWFSGGRAAYLAEAFHDTASWTALVEVNARGAAIAGASGGLGVLNAHVTGALGSTDGSTKPNGLGLAAPVRAMAHFDRMEARRPAAVTEMLGRLAPGQQLIGVDEDTACVWSNSAWTAMGRGRVNLFDANGDRRIFRHGEPVDLPKPIRSARPPTVAQS